MALLMTMDIMGSGRASIGDVESSLPTIIQEQIRMSMTSAPEYASRALHFYELHSNSRCAAVVKYLELFEIATGVNAVDCIMGGLDVVIREDVRELDEMANGWHATPRPPPMREPERGRSD